MDRPVTRNAEREADARARREALDPGRSFIVQAPAGSGKTELLTQRYLRLLATVDQPEEILAITFTNKAAGEMRDRVLRAIAAARQEQPAETHKQRTWELARAVRERSASQTWQLDENPARLRIETLDALAASLTQRLPVTAGLGMKPAIASRPQDLYADAARRTLALLEEPELGDAVATLMLHLGNNTARLERLLIDMLAKRDQWLRVLGRQDEREVLEAGLARECTSQLQAIRAAVPVAIADEWVELTRNAARNLARLEPDKGPYACVDLRQLPGTAPEDIKAWGQLAGIWQTDKGLWRKSLRKTQGFPTDRKELKQQATDFLSRLGAEDELEGLLASIQTVPAGEYADAQWTVLKALTQLLRLAAAQLWLVFSERGEVDFSEIASRAVRALGEPEAPTDLALSLDYRLRHVLVDEFQDTSWNQFVLLEPLTAGWAPDDGRSLFLVGDPMQSIYRFREAEVGLYLRAQQQGIGDIRLQPLTLNVNFRSGAPVIDWINEAFQNLFPAEEDIAAGAVAYSPAVANDTDTAGGVEILARFDGDEQDEAGRIVARVRERREANSDETIGILTRSRKHVAAVMQALRSAGLKAQAVELESLGDQPVVADLTALTRALVHRGDRLAWLAVLRAPWCGLTLADLAALCEGDERDIVSIVNDHDRAQALSAAGRERLERASRILQAALAQSRRQPLCRLVEQTWLTLGGPACVDAHVLDNAEAFFRLLGEWEEAATLSDTATLESELERLYARPAPDADSGLQVMTIHQAKGLEFDTVILPALERGSRNDNKQLLLWMERPRLDRQPDYLLAPITADGTTNDALYDSVNALRQEQDTLEQTRLLYVAATRSRQRLYLVGNVKTENDGQTLKPPSRGSLLAKLWPRVHPNFEEAFDKTPPAAAPSAGAQPMRGLRRLPADWRTPAPPRVEWRAGSEPAMASDAAVEFSWAGETVRQIGLLVHLLLDRITRDGPANWSAARVEAMAPMLEARLRREGIPAEDWPPACEKVIAAIRRMLEDDRGRWLLSAHEEGKSEYALSGVLDGQIVHRVIDRTFIDEHGVRWIVDYKSGGHEGGDRLGFLEREKDRYRAQLETYARLLAAGEQRPQRLGLYFPVFGGWIEWEP